MVPVLLTLVLAAAPDTARLAPGTAFPELRSSYLSGRRAVLPDDARGRTALLAFGFTYASRFPVEAWVKRFRERFGADSSVKAYEIPMVGGVARLARPFIDGGMRRGTPRAQRETVITVYGDTRPWKRRLGVDIADTAYLVLLDRDGRVAWVHRGNFDEADFTRLAAEVERLHAAPVR